MDRAHHLTTDGGIRSLDEVITAAALGRPQDALRDPDGVFPKENGKLVIQGGLLDEATKANLLNLLAGEGAVEIDVDVVRAALAKLM